MDSQKTSFKILMFPWLAHGHIFPYLELAKRISNKKSFHIHLCTTAVNFTSISTFLHTNSLQDSIQLIQLHLQPNPHLPPHLHTTKNLPSHLNPTLLKAFQTSKSSFSDIIINLKPNLVIYDVFQPWAPELSLSLGIPAVHFAPFGAASTAYAHQYYVSSDSIPPFPELCLKQQERESFDSLMDFLKVHVYDGDKDGSFINYKMSTEVVLLKTCRGFESKYLDYLSSVSQKRILAVGPLAAAEVDGDDEENSEILKWLSEKPRNSTVYISFGSECFLSEEEIAEIAKGLELCEANFIWVIRFPATEAAAVEGAVPRGFLEKVGGRGVVTGWAPQAKILGHPSTGCFVSHCGWSSLNESLYYGVPVVAMPMKLNMVVDAKILGGVGAGVEVRRREDGKYGGEEIGEAIAAVMEGEVGDGLRRRARDLSEKMKTEEGEAIDEAAEILWRLCCRNEGSVG